MERKTYSNDALGVSFSLPEAVTVREQLNLRGRLLDADHLDSAHVRWFIAARPLIDDWQSDDIPDLAEFELESVMTWRVGDVIQFVANESAGHFMAMADVPKK